MRISDWSSDVCSSDLVLLVGLFMTGVQSTLFGPVKYSILPAVLQPRELTGGNGLVEMGTSISILLGMILGGSIFAMAGDTGPWVAGGAIVALAVTGHLVSRAIPPDRKSGGEGKRGVVAVDAGGGRINKK